MKLKSPENEISVLHARVLRSSTIEKRRLSLESTLNRKSRKKNIVTIISIKKKNVKKIQAKKIIKKKISVRSKILSSSGSTKTAVKLKKRRKTKTKKKTTVEPKANIKLAPIFIRPLPKSVTIDNDRVTNGDLCEVIDISDTVIPDCDPCLNLTGCHIQQIPNELIVEWTNRQCNLDIISFKSYERLMPLNWTGTLGILDKNILKDLGILRVSHGNIDSVNDKIANDNENRNNKTTKQNKSYKRKNRQSITNNNTAQKTKQRKKKRNDVIEADLKEITATDDLDLITDEKERTSGILWVEKYNPTKSTDILNNAKAIKEVKEWLSYWKTKNLESIKDCTSTHKTYEDDSDFEISNDSEMDVPNCTIIFGPSGSGKTNLVYCLAQELGYKVFEVNTSSNRSGRNLIVQLREATQSHHVEGKVLSLDELMAMQSSVVKKSDSVKHKQETKKKSTIEDFWNPSNKREDHGDAFKMSEKPAVKKSSKLSNNKKEVSPQEHSITSFFQKTDKELNKPSKKNCAAVKSDIKKNNKKLNDNLEIVDITELKDNESQTKCLQTGLSISSLSIILFDDVDVIFEEDDGFWNAVNAFLRNTKKPVILTASNFLHLVTRNITMPYETILLELPDSKSICNHLINICKTENIDADFENTEQIIGHLGHDIRKSLLQLQYWYKTQNQKNNQNDSSLNNSLNDFKMCKSKTVTNKTGVFELILGNKTSIESFVDLMQSNQETARKIIQQGYFNNINIIYNNLPQLLPLFSCPVMSNTSTVTNGLNSISNEEKQKTIEISMNKNVNEIKPLNKIEKTVEHRMITSYFQTKKRIHELTNLTVDSLNAIAGIMDDVSFSDVLMCPLQKDNCNFVNNCYCHIDDEHLLYRSVITDLVSSSEVLSLKHTQNQLKKVTENVQEESYKGFFTVSFENKLLIKNNVASDCKLENNLKCAQAMSKAIPYITQLQRPAVCVDYLSTLRSICLSETVRQAANLKRSGRFLHYLNAMSLVLDSGIGDMLLK